MNKPEYILVDELGTIVTAVKTALTLTNLNYQYGYIRELNETLLQWSKNPIDSPKKYPLIWLEQPFTIQRGIPAYFGSVNIRLFIMMGSSKDLKAEQRMDLVYKAVIYPIYRELLNQMSMSPVFLIDSFENIQHTFEDRYFWPNQQEVLKDIIDCSVITISNLQIANNLNCLPKN